MSNPSDFSAIVLAPVKAACGVEKSSSPFALGVRCDSDYVTSIEYLLPGNEIPPQTVLAKEAVRQLLAWFADPTFALSLPLAPAGTPFQRRVWAAIAAIPVGQTQSYGHLAASMASGARAVGNACGANPYPLVVPCHRVIAADQSLGGFARQRGGFLLTVKQWLLQHERR